MLQVINSLTTDTGIINYRPTVLPSAAPVTAFPERGAVLQTGININILNKALHMRRKPWRECFLLFCVF